MREVRNGADARVRPCTRALKWALVLCLHTFSGGSQAPLPVIQQGQTCRAKKMNDFMFQNMLISWNFPNCSVMLQLFLSSRVQVWSSLVVLIHAVCSPISCTNSTNEVKSQIVLIKQKYWAQHAQLNPVSTRSVYLCVLLLLSNTTSPTTTSWEASWHLCGNYVVG